MGNRVLILNERAQAMLLDLVTKALTEYAGEVGKPSAAWFLPSHKKATANLATAAGIHAQLTEQLPDLSPAMRDPEAAHEARVAAVQPGFSLASTNIRRQQRGLMTLSERIAAEMTAAGLNLEIDDPRAMRPICAHGKPFGVPCADCERDESPTGPPPPERGDVGVSGPGVLD